MLSGTEDKHGVEQHWLDVLENSPGDIISYHFHMMERRRELLLLKTALLLVKEMLTANPPSLLPSSKMIRYMCPHTEA